MAIHPVLVGICQSWPSGEQTHRIVWIKIKEQRVIFCLLEQDVTTAEALTLHIHRASVEECHAVLHLTGSSEVNHLHRTNIVVLKPLCFFSRRSLCGGIWHFSLCPPGYVLSTPQLDQSPLALCCGHCSGNSICGLSAVRGIGCFFRGHCSTQASPKNGFLLDIFWI